MLGAGLGYGGGLLAEQLLPEQYFRKGRLRKVTGLAGGVLGALPGVLWGYDRIRSTGDTNSVFKSASEELSTLLSDEDKELNDMWLKASAPNVGYDPIIPVDQFNNTVWNDLRGQGGYTPAPIAAATTGLIQAASMSQGGVNLISPLDVARIGLGIGSGYASGLIVGKTLGALAGLRPEAQQQLQRTGAWAGLLANVVPLIF